VKGKLLKTIAHELIMVDSSMAMMTPFIQSLSKHEIGDIIMFEGACAQAFDLASTTCNMIERGNELWISMNPPSCKLNVNTNRIGKDGNKWQ
jgi:hypothetical protein